MSLRAHRAAVIAELEVRLPGSVFPSYSVKGRDGKPVAYPERYAVVFIALSKKDRPRHQSKQVRDVFTVTVHSVGMDEDLCFWVAERVQELAGRVLSVPGRVLKPVQYVTGVPPDLNDQGPVPLWFTPTQFDLISDPA